MRKPNIKSPLHFIGIGGSGMAPLAELCFSAGLIVQGSDPSPNKSTKRLTELGMKVFLEQAANNVPETGTVIYSSAILEENPELVAARTGNGQLAVLHRSQLLAEFVNQHHGITIAGTHGKTTTSAMTCFLLKEMGLDPSAAIGGRLLDYDRSALSGTSPYFVAEVDESDGTLIRYKPYISVLTNIGEDHLDNLNSIESIKTLFETYLSHTHPEGCAVLGWDNPYVRELGVAFKGEKLAYGFAIGSDVRAYEATTNNGGARFKAVVERDRVECKLQLLGRHNIQNALAALAVARALELDVRQAAECLGEFRGVARRSSIVYQSEGITILDDYAHNPDKIRACIESVASAFQGANVVVVFQPHRYSRLKTMFEGLAGSFSAADQVFVVPTYAAGEKVLDEFSSRRIADAIREHSGVACEARDNFALVSEAVAESIQKPAIILTVGAGDVWQCGPMIRDLLNGKNSQCSAQPETPKA